MREIRTHGSMSGRWKRSMVKLVRHRQTKGPETDRLHLNHRATSRLYSPLRADTWRSFPSRTPHQPNVSETPAFRSNGDRLRQELTLMDHATLLLSSQSGPLWLRHPSSPDPLPSGPRFWRWPTDNTSQQFSTGSNLKLPIQSRHILMDRGQA